MGAYELSNQVGLSAENKTCTDECIIAQKIFDQCRIQKCLTPCILGPARASRTGTFCGELLCEGDIIIPPCNAASVSLTKFKIKKIEITKKKKSPLKTGCWDIDIRYVFHYHLVFYKADGTEICTIPAFSSYSAKVTLFGSTETDVTVVTDLYCCAENLLEGPFVNVEGKALGLKAELKFPNDNCNNGCSCTCNCNCGFPCPPPCPPMCSGSDSKTPACPPPPPMMNVPIAVDVTIGLFSVVKLFRTVNMLVTSKGRCIPKEATTPNTDIDPCDFFNRLAFPMDLFAPPFTHESCCGTGDFSSPDCEFNDDDDCDHGHHHHDCGCGCAEPRRGCGCR